MDKEYYSLKDLISRHSVSFDATTILKSLVHSGIMADCEYLSTTGSGELKPYRVITPAGNKFGINKTTMHDFRTEPRFYINTFPELLSIVVTQLLKEVENIKSQRTE